jgi:hypothetical protein
MIFCCGGIWELTWWEIVTFTFFFSINIFLIINAPSSQDLTMEQTSYQSTSSEDSNENPTLQVNQTNDF